jgi:transposase
MEQRMNTRLFNLGKMQRETCEVLQTVCGDEALSRSSVFRWFKRFNGGSEDLQDDPKCGRPSTSKNADTKTDVREMVI